MKAVSELTDQSTAIFKAPKHYLIPVSDLSHCSKDPSHPRIEMHKKKIISSKNSHAKFSIVSCKAFRVDVTRCVFHNHPGVQRVTRADEMPAVGCSHQDVGFRISFVKKGQGFETQELNERRRCRERIPQIGRKEIISH